MKLTVKVQKEVNAKTLCVSAGARYPEDADVNGVRDEDGSLMPFLMVIIGVQKSTLIQAL